MSKKMNDITQKELCDFVKNNQEMVKLIICDFISYNFNTFTLRQFHNYFDFLDFKRSKE